MYAIIVFGVTLWLIYSTLVHNMPDHRHKRCNAAAGRHGPRAQDQERLRGLQRPLAPLQMAPRAPTASRI